MTPTLPSLRTWVAIALYLAAIVAANLAVAAYGPSITIVNAFVLIAFDLTARDYLHEQWRGNGLVWKMALLIGTGSLLAYVLNAAAGPIALASFVAFGVSGTLDGLTFHLLGDRARLVRVNGSNVIGAAADSLIFPTLAFGGFLPLIVLGQFAAKVAGGFIWSLVLNAVPVRRRAA